VCAWARWLGTGEMSQKTLNINQIVHIGWYGNEKKRFSKFTEKKVGGGVTVTFCQ
jgi:hypothetical protein